MNLEQKKVINYGDVENIVVEGKHEPIISKEDFDRAFGCIVSGEKDEIKRDFAPTMDL